MKHILYLTLLLLPYCKVCSQENLTTQEVYIKVGFSRVGITDHRLSAITHRSWAPRYGLSHTKTTPHSLSTFSMLFSIANSSTQGPLSIMSIMPNINYSYQRKVREGLWLGGYIDHMTLLNFPKTSSGLMNNNPISYHIAQSVGPRVTYTRGLTLGGNELLLQSSAQTSLLSYMIQPAYGHPYPTQFLKEEVFSPDRSGMAWPLIKSGKLATVNQVFSFRIELSIAYMINDKLKIGIDYQGNMTHANTRGKSLWFSNHDYLFTAAILY